MPDSEDAQAVEQANLAFYRAFETLDLAQMEGVWALAEPVTCIHPGWRLLAGWQAVMESWERIFDNSTAMQFTVTDAEATVAGDWAWVTCAEHLTSVVDGRVGEATVQATNIYRKRGDRWLMVHHHGSPSV